MAALLLRFLPQANAGWYDENAAFAGGNPQPPIPKECLGVGRSMISGAMRNDILLICFNAGIAGIAELNGRCAGFRPIVRQITSARLVL
jgi:hypothetical protein